MAAVFGDEVDNRQVLDAHNVKIREDDTHAKAEMP